MSMKSNNNKAVFIDWIGNQKYTHSLTLKPNQQQAAAAGSAFRILDDDSRYKLNLHTLPVQNKYKQMLNSNFSDNVLFSKLHRFHGLLDRKLVGRRFNEPKNAHLRTKIIAICEGSDVTGHLHCAIEIHESRVDTFNLMFSPNSASELGNQLWTKVAIGGTIQVDEIHDPHGWASYIGKSFYGENFTDRVMILS